MPVVYCKLARSVLPAFCALGLCVAAVAETASADPPIGRSMLVAVAGRDTPDRIAPLDLDDPPELLRPEKPRTEDDQDRLEALSMFSAARMLELKGEHAEALRLYQRALRYDPKAVPVARAIVPLAFQLNRHAEAVRYALKTVELEDADPVVLRHLGVHLVQRGDWQLAVALYEKAIEARKGLSPITFDVVLCMELGRLYHLLGEHAKAAEMFSQVLDAIEDPENSQIDEAAKKILLGEKHSTYSLIGECFLLADRTEEAVSAFEQSHKAQSNKGLLNYNLARVDSLNGETDRALERLQVYFDEHQATEGTAPYQLLSDLLVESNKQDELVERLGELHSEDPKNVPLAYFLAAEYRRRKQFAKSQTLYKTLLKNTPSVAGYRSLIDIYRETKDYEELLNVLGEAATKTSSLEPLGSEGEAVFDDADLVRNLIDIAKERRQDNSREFGFGLQLAMALLSLHAEQYDSAEEFFLPVIELKPDQKAELLLTWGVGLLVAGEHDRAAAVFRRGVSEKSLSDETPVFNYYLAGALEMIGQTDQALAAARKAVELKPDSPRFQSRVAWVLYHGDRHREAAEVYKELVEKFSDDYGSSLVRDVLREARLVLSNLAVIDGDIPRAEEWLEQVLDEFPDDVSAMNDLGYLWADAARHLDRAEKMIRKAVEAEPDNAAYRDSLGWVLHQLGRRARAVAELEKAAEMEPDPVILDHLGDAYQSNKQPQKAKESWQRAAEAFKEAEKTDEAEKVQNKIDAAN